MTDRNKKRRVSQKNPPGAAREGQLVDVAAGDGDAMRPLVAKRGPERPWPGS